MNIYVDAFGGDNAPLSVLQGAEQAHKELGISVTLTGDEAKIRKTAEENKISLEGISIEQANSVIDMHDDAKSVLKSKKDSSMSVGLSALAQGKGDAFVSAGNSGALIMGSIFLTKRIKGVHRPAFAPLFPGENGYFMMMDAGANTECQPEDLLQFAIMGKIYMESVMGFENPRVGLINNGVEETKGRKLEQEAYQLLSAAPINFKGNCEAREVPLGKFDVIVTDGFSGNIILKLYEGMGTLFKNKLKSVFMGSLKGKIAALFTMKSLDNFKKSMDSSEVGGAIVMGVQKPIIKAHGNSNGKAIYNAIRQAKLCVEGKMIEKIEQGIAAESGKEE